MIARLLARGLDVYFQCFHIVRRYENKGVSFKQDRRTIIRVLMFVRTGNSSSSSSTCCSARNLRFLFGSQSRRVF